MDTNYLCKNEKELHKQLFETRITYTQRKRMTNNT